jgi:hypothetical protein
LKGERRKGEKGKRRKGEGENIDNILLLSIPPFLLFSLSPFPLSPFPLSSSD